MADTSNLSNFLGDVADAIRAKKETTEAIPAANFDTEIASIETGTQLPEGIFVQEEIPPKTTNEAIWLKQSLADDTPFLDKLPDEILNHKGSEEGLYTVRDCLSNLSTTQIEEINNCSQHALSLQTIGTYNNTICSIFISDKLPFRKQSKKLYISGAYISYQFKKDGTITRNVYNNASVYFCEFTTTEGTQLVSTSKSYTDCLVSGAPIFPNIEFKNRTEPGLNIVNGDIMTIVYMNKSPNFEKILDTSNADAIASDLLEGKTAFVNNQKIIGTYKPPMTQEEYDTALNTAKTIAGNNRDSDIA